MDGFYIDYSIPEKRTKVIVDSFAKLPGESSSTNTRLLQLIQLQSNMPEACPCINRVWMCFSCIFGFAIFVCVFSDFISVEMGGK